VKDLETVILSGEEDESKQVVDVVLTHIVARQRTESKPSCAKGWGCDRNKNNRQCVEFGGGYFMHFTFARANPAIQSANEIESKHAVDDVRKNFTAGQHTGPKPSHGNGWENDRPKGIGWHRW